MKQIYAIKDKVTGEVIAVFMAQNDRDCVRSMAMSGFFKVARVEDTELLYCCTVDELTKEHDIVNIEEMIESLSMKIENEAEKIEGNAEEVAEKIKENVTKKNKK